MDAIVNPGAFSAGPKRGVEYRVFPGTQPERQHIQQRCRITPDESICAARLCETSIFYPICERLSAVLFQMT